MTKNYLKITKSVIAVISFLLLLFSQNVISRENKVSAQALSPNTVTVFPLQLQFIDDEALSGTSIKVAIFNKELTYIGPDLFKDADSLTDVYIPKNTKYIGDRAIPSEALIHVVRNSYARKWAKDNGYRYIIDNIWHDSVCPEGIRLEQLMLFFCIVIPVDEKKFELLRKSAKLYVKSMRPQDRPELNPIDYRFP